MSANQVATETGKRAAAEYVLGFIRTGMNIGLGTGSTANYFIDAIGQLASSGLDIKVVATSNKTHERANAAGLNIVDLKVVDRLDLTVDGADEIDPSFNLIKGGGGALLREKIVAASSEKFIVIADSSKRVATLGNFHLPIEIEKFGHTATCKKIEQESERLLGRKVDITQRRLCDGERFITDGGNFILDAELTAIPDPKIFEQALQNIPGIVETGLFINMCSLAVIGQPDGSVQVYGPDR